MSFNRCFLVPWASTHPQSRARTLTAKWGCSLALSEVAVVGVAAVVAVGASAALVLVPELALVWQWWVWRRGGGIVGGLRLRAFARTKRISISSAPGEAL